MNTNTTPEKKKRKKRTWLTVLIIFVCLLIVFRLFLPYIVLKVVNNKLAALDEYYGHVEDIDIALIRGAYQINDIEILKKEEETKQKDTTPFFKSPQIDFSVEWSSIFKGAIVGEITVEQPIVNFVKGQNKDKEVKDDTTDFKQVIRDLMPLTINHFEINNGTIRYIDKFSSPHVDVNMTNLYVKADNLSNVNDSNDVLPAALKAEGNAYDGKFDLNVKFNALEKQPTFDLNAKVSEVNLVKLNDFFKAYGKFDVEKGVFGLYTEFAAKNGAFKGYVKPLIKDLKVLKLKEEEGNAVQIAWEAVVGGVGKLFSNWRKDQVATKVPLEGKFENPSAGLWTAISYVLRNAFVAALQPSVDNTISIGNVEVQNEEKTFLQKVFGKKDDKEKSKEKDKDKDRKKKEKD